MKAYRTSQGNWQVNFSEGGKQKTLYLGRSFTALSSDRVARIVTEILGCRKRGESVPREVFRQVSALPEKVRRSFERLGLIDGVTKQTLAELLDSFYETKSHLKFTTQYAYKLFGRLLLEYFGRDCRIETIDNMSCERFRNHLLSSRSSCTVSCGIRRCRTIFSFAVKSGWLQENPFCAITRGSDVNLERQVYVDRETIYKVMSSCRDDYDRFLLALGRFCGLRIPSEVKMLRFSDFVDNEIRIHHDTKTGARAVPLFGEVREIFDRIVNLRKSSGIFSPAELVFVNLGDFFHRIGQAIVLSGVERWSKLFVNLRSSCITDLSERGYSEKTMDAIFGNSALVRSRHYVQFRKEKEYAKVLEDDERLLKKLREGVACDSFSAYEINELLMLRDLLVKRFGSGKHVV
jgi:site-specific recombinase XerD